ncbi:MAG: FAD-dependent thymidylate synthase [Candidatus Marinimicrobia bacterium]|nr:FAD-dependent thymidylate synthase [bacterium]MCG2715018.1 FAD-dependent thymidylate synthase [Candidatus Neomarinimicrobiota bacterium]
MAHIIVPEAEAILDKEFKVLDKGFVRLIDYLGGDSRIVQSARVSYGQGTKSVREDRALIDYLMSHQHTSPFEQVILTFHCKMPIFIARQWIRHRTARINEISGRYSIMENEFYVPNPDQIKFQSKDNRQGRAEEEVPVKLRQKVLNILINDQKSAYENYGKLIEDGIARELARINLPLSLYTQWYWQIDLNNLFHFLKLRLDYHAQWEIRQYGKAMAEITKAVAPMAYKAFETHVLNAISFSGKELEALANQLQGKDHQLKGIYKTEFEAKIQGH